MPCAPRVPEPLNAGPDPLLDTPAISAYTGFPIRLVRRLIIDRDLPVTKVRSRVYIRRSDLDAYIASCERPAKGHGGPALSTKLDGSPEPLLDPVAASAYCGLPLGLVRRLITDRELPAIKVRNRRVFVRRSDLDAYITSCEQGHR